MTVTTRLEGFKGLEDELAKLEKLATRKSVARRSLKKAAEPLADLMRRLAPDDPATQGEDLAASIAVSTKLSKRQRGSHRKMFRNDKAAVEMFVGAGPLPQAHNQEFGNIIHAPQPFARPAWEQDQNALLERLGKNLWDDVQKTIARANARAARG